MSLLRGSIPSAARISNFFSSKKRRKSKKAFTLFETAIYILAVVILTVTVLTGKELIYNAQVQSILSEVDRLKIAFGTFKKNNGFAPGDMTLSQCNIFFANHPNRSYLCQCTASSAVGATCSAPTASGFYAAIPSGTALASTFPVTGTIGDGIISTPYKSFWALMTLLYNGTYSGRVKFQMLYASAATITAMGSNPMASWLPAAPSSTSVFYPDLRSSGAGGFIGFPLQYSGLFLSIIGLTSELVTEAGITYPTSTSANATVNVGSPFGVVDLITRVNTFSTSQNFVAVTGSSILGNALSPAKTYKLISKMNGFIGSPSSGAFNPLLVFPIGGIKRETLNTNGFGSDTTCTVAVTAGDVYAPMVLKPSTDAGYNNIGCRLFFPISQD